MSFWTDSKIQIKQKSRFVVIVGGDFNLPNVKSVSKPSLSISNKEFKLLNHTFKYPSTVKWNSITITFIDMNGNGDFFDTGGLLHQMLNNSGYNYPHSATHKLGTKGGDARNLSSPEKASSIANSFGKGLAGTADNNPSNWKEQSVKIIQVTPGGEANESWTLVNPLIKSIIFFL